MDKNPLVLLELVERLANLMRAELRQAGADESLQPFTCIRSSILASRTAIPTPRRRSPPTSASRRARSSQTLLSPGPAGPDRALPRTMSTGASCGCGCPPPASSCSTKPSRRSPGRTADARNISPNRIRNATSALRETLATFQEDNEGAMFGECTDCTHCTEALAAHLPVRTDGRPALRARDAAAVLRFGESEARGRVAGRPTRAARSRLMAARTVSGAVARIWRRDATEPSAGSAPRTRPPR